MIMTLDETAASDCTPTAADTTTQSDDSTASELVQARIDEAEQIIREITPRDATDQMYLIWMISKFEEWRAERRAA